MDKHSGILKVDLTRAAQELLAFVNPEGRVFRSKVRTFGITNAPAIFQELMNTILYILRCRPPFQELVSGRAEMEAHIDYWSLGTNTREDHILVLQEFFTVCQRNHVGIKLEKCQVMHEEMEYLGFDIGYGWCRPAASKTVRCNSCGTCRSVMTPRGVFTTYGVLLARAIFTGAIYRMLQFLQPA